MTMNSKSKKNTEAERVHRAFEVALKSSSSPIDDREKSIIEQYYGFNGNFRHTLQEVGDLHGITRERVRQIKHYALRKIGATDN